MVLFEHSPTFFLKIFKITSKTFENLGVLFKRVSSSFYSSTFSIYPITNVKHFDNIF